MASGDAPLTSLTAAKNHPATVVNVSVCQGVDCKGRCSGAALLELEELCAEHAGVLHMDVSPAPCTLRCHDAPVVRLHMQAPAQEARTAVVTHVDQPLRCGEVVEAADDLAGVRAADGHFAAEFGVGPNAGPPAKSLTLRRAHALRWDALRVLARDAGAAARGEGVRLLAQARAMEERAAGGDPKALARAQRRHERILERITRQSPPTSPEKTWSTAGG